MKKIIRSSVSQRAIIICILAAVAIAFFGLDHKSVVASFITKASEEKETELIIPSSDSLQNDTIYFRDHVIPFECKGKSEGQKWIDQHPDTQATTYGGMKFYSGTDHHNTHFIGHNPGAFEPFADALVGEEIAVTDYNKKITKYVIKKIAVVDRKGYDVNTRQSLRVAIIDPGMSERITLQTCLDENKYAEIFAYVE
jgi:hypothetical protein